MMYRDSERDTEVREDDFKNTVFANSPDLYKKLFQTDESYLDEEEIDHIAPESDEDFEKLMRELKQLGVIN